MLLQASESLFRTDSDYQRVNLAWGLAGSELCLQWCQLTSAQTGAWRLQLQNSPGLQGQVQKLHPVHTPQYLDYTHLKENAKKILRKCQNSMFSIHLLLSICLNSLLPVSFLPEKSYKKGINCDRLWINFFLYSNFFPFFYYHWDELMGFAQILDQAVLRMWGKWG